MTEKRESVADRARRKLFSFAGKSRHNRRDVSNTGVPGDNRGGEIGGWHFKTEAHDKKLRAIPSDKVIAYVAGNNEDNLSIRARADQSGS